MGDADDATVVRGDDQSDDVERDPYLDVGEDDFIIELRTHGVSGTPPESMLNTSAVVQVWGDETGRFFRPADTLGNEVWEVAPVERETGKPVPRFREGYHWGKMTSGGLRQALWALLVPFALVNLSQWMVPPVAPGRGGFAVVALLRALVRVVGLGLTLVFMVQWAVLIVDIIAVQCLGQDMCLKSWAPVGWVRGHPLAITTLVLLALAVPVFVASRITAQSRAKLDPAGEQRTDYVPYEVERESKAAQAKIQTASTKPVPHIAAPDFYSRRNTAPARTLHATVALAGTALVLSGGAGPLPTLTASITWWVAAGLIGIGVVFAMAMDDPRGSGGRFWRGHWVNVVLFGDSWRRGLWWGVAAADLVAAAYLSFLPILEVPSPHWGHGIDALLQTLFVALAFLCLAALLVAVVGAVRSHRAYFGGSQSAPKAFRPWVWGIATAVVLPFAALLGAGLGTGMTETVQNCLTTGCKPELLLTPMTGAEFASIELPRSYDAIALLWGLTGVIVLTVALLMFLGGLGCAVARRSYAVAELVQAGRSMLFTWFFAGLKVRADRLLFGVVVVAVVAGAVSALAVPTRFVEFVEDCRPLEIALSLTGLTSIAGWLRDGGGSEWVPVLQSLGLLVLALIVIGLLYAIYNAYRRPDSTGRSLGVLWDLASFWPTESHPLVPPCYARKAIDDLTERVKEYRTDYPKARIVLCGHSQGSTLMYATVLRLAKLDEAAGNTETGYLSRVGLVTHGSQLQWAYGRAFPDMLSYFSHGLVMSTLDRRWHNLIRFTDPLGGAVLSWNLRIETDTETKTKILRGNALPGDSQRVATKRESGAWVIGNERWLPDPVVRKPIFPARKHSDYTLDPVG
jgi:hypothetical protein